MLHSTAPVLFESTDNRAVLSDPVNQPWLAVVERVSGELFEVLSRRYYLALYDFRKRTARPELPGKVRVVAEGKKKAQQAMLELIEARKEHPPSAVTTFVEARDFVDDGDDGKKKLPDALKDFEVSPPPLAQILGGRGRPPADALCLMRAFLAAPVMGVGDDPTSVHDLLHSNPTFARMCGFLGRDLRRQPGDLTSRRLPAPATCEEFDEVMTRYGLWQHARLQRVRDNLESGVVEVENTLAFDTTHLEANSHCSNVSPGQADGAGDKKVKQRKVPRVRKHCDCGKECWETCEHPWSPTDQGAAVVVKGKGRAYWAHKCSVASFGDSEIPIDARALNYAAQSDGKTLMPHLEVLESDLPEVIKTLLHVLADSAYVENRGPIAERYDGAQLHAPVRGRNTSAQVAKGFAGVDHFTPTGVPVCEAGHYFEMRGRDITKERYIWAAPDGHDDKPVCQGCPLADNCLHKGTRRHVRVERKDFPQINWEHPQHLARNRARYARRTGVERAIKRVKVDLRGEHLTRRDVHRVQAHLDRRLLVLHLLLAAAV